MPPLGPFCVFFSRRESTSDIGSANAGRSILVPNRRRRTVDIAGGKVITAEKKISDMSQSLLDHTSSTRRRVSDTAIDFPLRTTRCATEVAHVSNSEARTAKGVRGAPETVKQPPPHPIVAGKTVVNLTYDTNTTRSWAGRDVARLFIIFWRLHVDANGTSLSVRCSQRTVR